MDGVPDISLLSGWAFASFVAITVVMSVIKGALVPGPTHEAMRTDRDYYREELRKQTAALLDLPHAVADLQTIDQLQRGLSRRPDPRQGTTP